MKGYLPPIILLLVAACVYLTSANSSKTPAKKDWVKIRACIAKSAKILNEEAMKTYVLIDWDKVTPEQMDDRTKLLSRLNVEKIDRDSKCREKYSF